MLHPGLSARPLLSSKVSPLVQELPALRVNLRNLAIVEVNSALAELAGQVPEALVGRPLADCWLPDERKGIVRRFEDVILFGDGQLGAMVFVPLDGPGRWVEVEARYVGRGGQYLEVLLRPIAGPMPMEGAVVDLAAGAKSDPWAPAPNLARALPADAVTLAGRPEHGRPRAADHDVLHPDGLPFATFDHQAEVVMAALDATGAAALAVAADGRIQSATPAVEQLIGTTISHMRGKRLEDVLELAEAGAHALGAARRGRTRQSVRVDLPMAEGAGPSPVLEWLPGPVTGAGYAILVSGRTETEDDERTRLQSQLVALVSHDVRDSLAAVVSGLHLLATELPADSPARTTFERVMTEGRRASRIVEDVLAVTRPGRIKPLALDLTGLLLESLTRFRPRAMAHGVALREVLVEGVQVAADPTNLDRAFGNLFENALQAMPCGGTLTLTVAREDRSRPGVVVTVSDTGVGIHRELRPNVFEPFVTNKDEGTGLGLAITRRIVIDHAGQIDFESTVGAGTTFHVWLPVVSG